MASAGSSGIDGFNRLTERQRMHLLYDVCASPIWARRVLAGGPFRDADGLLDRADRVLAELPDAEIVTALDGHPRIGGRVDNAASAREQAGMDSADDAIRTEMARANAEYENRFGHVYLVYASGRSAKELLAILYDRLDNDSETERRVMRSELAKINRHRLERLLSKETP